MQDKIKSIYIFSDEPWAPWEILKPWRGKEGGDYFLCERYSFTRWPIRSYNGKENLLIKNARNVVSSDIKLSNALKECEWIKKELGSLF